MATKMYLRTGASSAIVCGTGKSESLLLTAGAALAVEDGTTAAGPVAICSGRYILPATGETWLEWVSNPLEAVTISGTITVNLWMSESNMSANAGAQISIQKILGTTTSTPGAGSSILGCAASCWFGTGSGTTAEKGTELPVTTRAAQNWTATPASVTVNAGERLSIRVQANDAGGDMNTGHTFDLGYNGGTAAADGDSWVQFTETLTEYTASTTEILGMLVGMAQPEPNYRNLYV